MAFGTDHLSEGWRAMAPTQRAYQKWARRGTTTQRGYGSAHQAERERRLAQYRPGDLCAHGGEPLLWWPVQFARRYLDLPHTSDRTGYLPGLSCRRHNRGEGATRGNRTRGQRVRLIRAGRRW